MIFLLKNVSVNKTRIMIAIISNLRIVLDYISLYQKYQFKNKNYSKNKMKIKKLLFHYNFILRKSELKIFFNPLKKNKLDKEYTFSLRGKRIFQCNTLRHTRW